LRNNFFTTKRHQVLQIPEFLSVQGGGEGDDELQNPLSTRCSGPTETAEVAFHQVTPALSAVLQR
jgi:hypothetical protein